MARHHLGATWIDDESLAYNTYSGAPTGSNRRGLVRFADGSLRIVRLGVPDTYFSLPAKPSTGRIGSVMVGNGPTGDEYRFHARGGGGQSRRRRRTR
jgi:hypothetical protein